jgi:hypothetical protein
MKDEKSSTVTSAELGELSATLLELRDAFMALSLALKDWQFEADQAKRTVAEDQVRQLLEKINLPRDAAF